MHYEWTKESQARIDKWRAQGHELETHIPARIVGVVVSSHTGMNFQLEALVHVKDDVELGAKPSCPNCQGSGRVRYWYAQDESRSTVCPMCYPNDLEAVRELANFTKFSSR